MSKSFRVLCVLLALCAILMPLIHGGEGKRIAAVKAGPNYDPLAVADASKGVVKNLEATVLPQCYTATAGVANPCWTCHNDSVYPNQMNDVELQEEYAFSDVAMTNHWGNLFVDRSEDIAKISDDEILAWVKGDNYTPLRENLKTRTDYEGYVPDLDFAKGFDDEGFARDGSGWRAFRYKPWPGTFWPTNGSTDDVMIRLPRAFQTSNKVFNKDVYKANLSILEAAIAAGPEAGNNKDLVYPVEPLREDVVGTDLNGDGMISGVVTQIKGLPSHYLGDAAFHEVKRYVYPKGTEYLHSVRYLDPTRETMMATRMKELRYSKKVAYLDDHSITLRYEQEYNDKEEGTMPFFAGAPRVGLRNGFGWQLQGFIEDEVGLLRLQTQEEQWFCMGCHSAMGATVDHTFSLPRKLPGKAGWAYQNIAGMKDVPQQGHEKGEIATYFERVGGGDEFRANDEILERFFDEAGKPREDLIREAGVAGSKDIRYLVMPSRERAILLNKAYKALVEAQAFDKGRDALIKPPTNVHQRIENGSTDLSQTGKVFGDGRAWLRW